MMPRIFKALSVAHAPKPNISATLIKKENHQGLDSSEEVVSKLEPDVSTNPRQTVQLEPLTHDYLIFAALHNVDNRPATRGFFSSSFQWAALAKARKASRKVPGVGYAGISHLAP